MNKKTTIRDVAKAAGVSITTVSQILNGVDEFSETTVKRVWDTVNAMNYVPNPLAKQLLNSKNDPNARMKTGLLLRINFLPYDHERSAFDLLEEHRMFYFNKFAAKRNFFATNYTYVHEKGFRCPLLQKDLVDGAILGLPHKEIIQTIASRMPAVLTDFNINPEEFGVPVVNMDFISGFQSVFQRMTDAGISRKLIVLRVNYQDRAEYRLESHATEIIGAAANAGMELERDWILNMDITPDTHWDVMRQIAEKVERLIRENGIRLVAMKGFSYATALAELLKARGFRIPGDVVLVSDGFPASERDDIVLLHYDWENLFSTALEVLSRIIEGENLPNRKYLIPCKNNMDSLTKTL